jgi:hypothetical protein
MSQHQDSHAAGMITLTRAMIDAATDALADDGVFSDDHGWAYPDPVAAKHALVAAMEAGGFAVKIEGVEPPKAGSHSRTASRVSR